MSQHDFLIREQWERSARATNNPINKYGAKYFSQSDEDGITLEIIGRLGICAGSFAELGVGNGLENNTIILLASGWRGFWIGGEDLQFNDRLNPKKFTFYKRWVTLENIVPLIRNGIAGLNLPELDVLGIDLDGNDYYFVREILNSEIRPKILIVEYNAKFPPPIKWVVPYDTRRTWDRSDYFGASLASFVELLQEFSYSIVCCNAATGANAFFVADEYVTVFQDVPRDLGEIFVGCRYQLPLKWGHHPSPRTIERIIEID